MSKTLIFISALIFINLSAFSQKAEVIYFKANLPCCQATACNNLENQVKDIVESNFTKGDVAFTTKKIADPDNKDLVEKYNAKSQTLIIVGTSKKGKSNTLDVSDILRKYRRSEDADELENTLVAKIKESMK